MAAGACDERTLDGAEQEFWMNTAAVLAMLLHWSEIRRKRDDRSPAAALLKALVADCLPVPAVESIAPLELLESERTRCMEGAPDGQSCCACWQRRVLKEGESGAFNAASPQERVSGILKTLFHHRSCPSISARCSRLVLQVAAAVEQSVESWGCFDWQFSSQAVYHGAARSRRIDPHLKQFAVSGAIAEGRVKTVGQATKAIGMSSSSTPVQWSHSELAAYRASSLLSFGESQYICVAVDGARVGKPAKELIFGVLSSPAQNRSCIMPPQAPACVSDISLGGVREPDGGVGWGYCPAAFW